MVKHHTNTKIPINLLLLRFSGGPVSQNDTIELRGFEEGDKATGSAKKKQTPAQKKRTAAKERKTSNSEQQPTLKKTEEDAVGEKREEAEGEKVVAKRESETKDSGGDGAVESGEKSKEKEQNAPSLDFFFNESISGLLTVSCRNL